MQSRIVAAGFAAALSLAAFSPVFAAKPDDSGNAKKEYVCHYTGSGKNPVVLINVGNRAAFGAHTNKPGHGHQGDDATNDARPTSIEGCLGGGEGEIEQ